MRAHLHDGVPVSEVDVPAHFWQNYAGLHELLRATPAASTLFVATT